MFTSGHHLLHGMKWKMRSLVQTFQTTVAMFIGCLGSSTEFQTSRTWFFLCLFKTQTLIGFTFISINFASNVVIKREERKIFDCHTRSSSPLIEFALWCSQAVHCIIEDPTLRADFFSLPSSSSSSLFIDIRCERFFIFLLLNLVAICFRVICTRKTKIPGNLFPRKRSVKHQLIFISILVREESSPWTQRYRCRRKINAPIVEVRWFDRKTHAF